MRFIIVNILKYGLSAFVVLKLLHMYVQRKNPNVDDDDDDKDDDKNDEDEGKKQIAQ